MMRDVKPSESIKGALTIAGQRTPADLPRLLNAVANFLETGRRLRERDLPVPHRVCDRAHLFDHAIKAMQTEASLYLEFGVFQGDTIRYWVDHLDNERASFFGFDSFEGLPEDWTAGAGQGHFSTAGLPPEIADRRVTFVKGWFESTLKDFSVPKHDRLFINVDSDLYSSASTVLSWAAPHIQIGDFLYFDEFHDRANEGRAFHEFLDGTGYQMSVIAATRSLTQILFQRVG